MVLHGHFVRLFIYAIFICLSYSAYAADGPKRNYPSFAPPPAPVPNYGQWDGYYIGGSMAEGITTTTPDLPTGSLTNSVIMFGVYGGRNVQFAQYVIGGEAEIGAIGNLSTSTSTAINALKFVDNTTTPPITTHANVSAQSVQDLTLRGRVRMGYSFAQAWLAFIAAGITITNESLSLGATPALLPTQTASAVLMGYNIGLGVDYALSDRLNLRTEFIHDGFGSQSFQFAQAWPSRTVSLTQNTLRSGVALRF
jgi:outer membrane immunogenic protein